MVISPKIRMLILMLIAFAATWVIYRPILRIARSKMLTDNPGERKLQKSPVPVLGGIAVFFGIVVGLCYFKTMLNYVSLFPMLGAMVIMLYVGTIDDVSDLSPWIRIAVETGVALLMIYGNRTTILAFDGLFGLDTIPLGVSIPLTVLMTVGVINAINMIDGIDGLVSGMMIFASACFGLIFFFSHDYSFTALSAVMIGALLQFFLHNVFGRETKMFIGDGGTMMVGTVMSAMVIELLSGQLLLREFQPAFDFNLVCLALSVLSIPVFDTLRVMTARMAKGVSPFHADNTHLHHLFLRCGFSHLGTVVMMVGLDAFTVLAWLLAWWLGALPTLQLAVTVAAALLADCGTALLLSSAPEGSAITRLGAASHMERKGFWAWMQKVVDRV